MTGLQMNISLLSSTPLNLQEIHRTNKGKIRSLSEAKISGLGFSPCFQEFSFFRPHSLCGSFKDVYKLVKPECLPIKFPNNLFLRHHFTSLVPHTGLEMRKKTQENKGTQTSLPEHLSHFFLFMSSLSCLQPSPQNTPNSSTLDKSCLHLCAERFPSLHPPTHHKNAHHNTKTLT